MSMSITNQTSYSNLIWNYRKSCNNCVYLHQKFDNISKNFYKLLLKSNKLKQIKLKFQSYEY